MKKVSILVLLLVLWSLPAAAAMRVAKAVITTEVSERTPIDSVQTYPASVTRLYFFTHVLGATGETSVTHVWYLGDTEVARVELPVRSSSWRTWSTKSFLPEWTGDWRVEILDPQGEILETVSFILN